MIKNKGRTGIPAPSRRRGRGGGRHWTSCGQGAARRQRQLERTPAVRDDKDATARRRRRTTGTRAPPSLRLSTPTTTTTSWAERSDGARRSCRRRWRAGRPRRSGGTGR
uniref:Uncharacterized protein n=1 Tax=Zea mays TaxID=4577 RepID=C4IYF5_MAIZE|nr:unknown [Zea mays]